MLRSKQRTLEQLQATAAATGKRLEACAPSVMIRFEWSIPCWMVHIVMISSWYTLAGFRGPKCHHDAFWGGLVVLAGSEESTQTRSTAKRVFG